MATGPRPQTDSPPSLHALLKAETAEIHERLETRPFFQALRAGTLPPLAIVSFLRSLAIIHAVLEREITTASNTEVAALGTLAPSKVPLLIADLEALQGDPLPSVAPAVQVALDCAADLLAGAHDPLSLVGALYVLEGSQNGGVMLKRSYATCLQVTPEQLSYFGCYGSSSASHWQSFTHQMNQAARTSDQAQAVVRSAIRCFEWIDKISLALFPYDERDLRHHVAAINFEAGDHTMPQDPREIALALRAGRAAWDRYPYLELRFGERGRRFTNSDSCWLVALTRLPADAATKSLEWLRSVLGSRGIPTVILEEHLRAIAGALAAEFPDQPRLAVQFDRFLAAREAERASIAGEDTLVSIIDRFDLRLNSVAGLRVAAAAQLIASAWIDERNGIPGALAATRSWFVDAGRFSPDWVGIANELLNALDAHGRSSC